MFSPFYRRANNNAYFRQQQRHVCSGECRRVKDEYRSGLRCYKRGMVGHNETHDPQETGMGRGKINRRSRYSDAAAATASGKVHE